MSLDRMFSTFGISASGLAAERVRMDVTAHNLANANSTGVARDRDGTYVPFCKQEVVFRQVLEAAARAAGVAGLGGVAVEAVVDSGEPPREVLRPGHPHANAEGKLLLPNVDSIAEMVNLITAQRAYQANLAAIRNFREMMQQTLRLGR